MSGGKAQGEARSQWESLVTEARHPQTLDLDTRSAEEVVRLVLEEDRRGLDAALRHSAGLAGTARWVAETLRGGGRIFFVGAGTSGRLGVLEAAECPPTFGTDPQRIRALIAGGENAVFRAKEGAEDREDDGRVAADELGPGDLLIALSASSVTPYARGALAGARHRGARTVLLTCAAATGLDGLADLVIALETGPEVLTGSTRLKAGSATKAALNAVTTAAMVQLGKVFENLMVDLRPGSAKLEDRARRIVSAAGKVSRREGDSFYVEAGHDVKAAIVMARRGVDAETARALLDRGGGSVRRALDETL